MKLIKLMIDIKDWNFNENDISNIWFVFITKSYKHCSQQ